MAVSTPVLATPGTGATATSATTASFTPTANAILIAFTMARGGSAAIPTISDSLGGTWTPIAAGQDAGFVTGRLFYQEVGASPSARTVTAAATSATQTALAIVEVTGAGTDFSNYDFDITTGTSQSMTLSSYAAGSQVLAGIVDNAGGTQTFTGSLTELYDANLATNTRSSIAYEDAATAPTTINVTSSASDNYAWALEIKEPAGGSPQQIDGALFVDGDTFPANSIMPRITVDLFVDPDTFHAATLTPGNSTITGALFTDADTFHGATLSVGAGPQTITGALFEDTDAFHAATLTPGVATINGALYSDPDIFYAATVTGGGGGGGGGGDDFILLRRRRRS